MNRVSFCIFAVICMMMLPSCGSETDLAKKLWSELDLTAAPNTLTAKEKEAGWELLFDGATFSGWHGYNTPGQIPSDWAIEDGTMTVNGTGGGEEHDVITNSVFRDFAFTVEYKLTVGANSGIIYHIKEDTLYTFPYETGPEFQLADMSNRPPERRAPSMQTHGANYGMYQPTSEPFNPAGEWNRLMLIIKEHETIHVVNGVEIVRFVKYSDEWNALRNSGKWNDFPDYGKFDEGHISLQNHGHKLWFRNVKIKRL